MTPEEIYSIICKDKFIVIDDLFQEDVCHKLRDIALSSEKVDLYYKDYYAIDYHNPIYNITSSLNIDDNYLITTEIPNHLKNIFPFLTRDGMDFQRGWCFVHDNIQYHSVKKHKDPGSYITCNLWVTPDENRKSISENNDGFVIYANEYPAAIPYKFNRMTIFLSQTFHESKLCRFKEGKENRKVNYTFLFGQKLDIR